MQALNGKVALITGASEGIGAALAEVLKARGAKLSLVARREDRLILAGGSEAVITAGDITDAAVRQRALQATIEKFGRLDVLINNAGRGLYQNISNTRMDDAKRLMELNFFAPLALTQLAASALQETRGCLVNVSSIAGKLPLPWLPVYSASKAALESITETCRMELAGSGVHVMCVSPGYVTTRFQDNAAGSKPPDSVVKGKRFAVSAEQCAEAIVHGIEHRKRTVVTPRAGWALVWVHRLLPKLVESRLRQV